MGVSNMSNAERARIAIQVVAGIIPGQPLPELTKQFIITSELWYSDAPGDAERCKEIQEEAIEYQKSLMNPSYSNWVRLEWIWF